MRAVIWTAYGPPDVLQLQEVDRPTPKDDEVLIRVHASSVTAGDCEARSLDFPLFLSLPMRAYVGFSGPRRVTILGQDLAGEIEAVGKDVRRFEPGDRVFGATGLSVGTYAEYVVLPEEPDEGVLARMPANATYEEAAAAPLGGLEALHFLGKADVQSGEKVLINGAGGSIGTSGVQYAKSLGAEVTAVDSAEKLDMLRSIGADHVIDYTEEDFTRNGETYDVIFDVVGKSPYSRSVRSLSDGGRYLLANPTMSLMLRAPWTSMTGSKKVVMGVSSATTGDLVKLRSLMEAGTIEPVIDRTYPLEQTAEAHEYVEAGHKQGNLVITLEETPAPPS